MAEQRARGRRTAAAMAGQGARGERTIAADAVPRWNPRFLATVATPDPALPILRLDQLRPREAAALRAAAAAVGARAAVGPLGALVAGTWEQQAALAAHLAGDDEEPGAAGGGLAAHGWPASRRAHAARRAGCRRGVRPPPAGRLGAALAATLAHQHGRTAPTDPSGGDDLGLGPAHLHHGHPEPLARLLFGRWSVGRGRRGRPGAGVRRGRRRPPRRRRRVDAARRAAHARGDRASPRAAGAARRPGGVPLPLSIDTYKAPVAAAALAAGAVIVNDATGLRGDPAIAAVAAAAGAALIVTHNRPAAASGGPLGATTPPWAIRTCSARCCTTCARSSPVPRRLVCPGQIVVDPGIGFGKTREQNLTLLARLGELRALGRPLLLGTSRKSVIGLTLGLPPDQREEGTAATVALGIRAGADVVRVHDVRSMALVARLSDAIVRQS